MRGLNACFPRPSAACHASAQRNSAICGRSCASAVYPAPCASRRSRSDAPVIRRNTPPRRQRVLSPSSAQWSPGSSLGWWCKSLFVDKYKSAPVTEGPEFHFGARLLRPFETMRAPRHLHGDRASVRKERQMRVYSCLAGHRLNSCGLCFAMSAALGPDSPCCGQGVGSQEHPPLSVYVTTKAYDKHKNHDVML